MSYKKTDALMRHLRDSGIAISGGKQKRQLIPAITTAIKDIVFSEMQLGDFRLPLMTKYTLPFNMIQI